MLNYFNTTGEAWEAAGGSCTYFTDRDDDAGRHQPAAARRRPARCGGRPDDFDRQQAKIVPAINTIDADIVSLEEIENSVKLLGETDRDDAVTALVTALNAAAGSTPGPTSPRRRAADRRRVAEQDVIRTASSTSPTTVAPVGASRPADRQPRRSPTPASRSPRPSSPPARPTTEAFAVIVNHFKSKGCSGADRRQRRRR